MPSQPTVRVSIRLSVFRFHCAYNFRVAITTTTHANFFLASASIDGDITSFTSTLTFTNEQLTDCILINITDDSIVEVTENFIITLVPPVGEQYAITGPAILTILDDDGGMYIFTPCI